MLFRSIAGRGLSLHRHYPASSVLWPPPTSAPSVPLRHVRVAIPTARISPVAHTPFSSMLLPLTPVDRTGAPVDSSPSIGAFPEAEAGRRPRLSFSRPARHSTRYSLLDRSAALGGLCHEASTRQLPTDSRSSASEPYRLGSCGLLIHWVHDRFRTHSALRLRANLSPQAGRGKNRPRRQNFPRTARRADRSRLVRRSSKSEGGRRASHLADS